jgi:hypothetical protein
MGSRANNLPDRPHRALRLGATPAHYYGGHAPRAGGCPARLPYTPASLPYTPPQIPPRARPPHTPPHTPTSLPYTPPPKRCPNPPTLCLTEILYSNPAIYPLILHRTFLILFPYKPLESNYQSHQALLEVQQAKVANRFPSNKGSSKQPSPLIYHMQPPIPRPRLPYSREASPAPPLPVHE